MNNSSLLSVIIPVYNTAPYLRRCLSSICEQTYENLEIICVNDGSTDESGAILEELAQGDSRIRIVTQENAGQASARNKGLKLAKGKLITFVDSDDYILRETYERAVAALPEDCEVLAFGICIEGDMTPKRRSDMEEYYALPFQGIRTIGLEEAQKTDVAVCNKIFKADFLQKYGLFFPEGLLFEDAAFMVCVFASAKKIFFLNEETYCYCVRENSTMSNARNSTPRVLDHLLILYPIYDFFKKHSLFETRKNIYRWAYFYCSNFYDNHASPENKARDLPRRQQLAMDISPMKENHASFLSIIVPVYNTAPYLRRCLSSICGQTYGDMEIICVNDGSTDESLQILQEYAKTDSRIRIVSQKNAGLSAARNTGMKIATGELITFVDSDDYIKRETYERALTAIPPDCEVLAFGTAIEGDMTPKRRSEMEKYYTVPYEGLHAIGLEQAQKTDVSVWNKVFRAEFLQEYGLNFPEGLLFEDACFMSCVFASAKKIFYLNEKMYCYCVRGGSLMSHAVNGTSKVMDHLRILYPIYAFFKEHGLFETREDIFLWAYHYCNGFYENHASQENIENDIFLRRQLAKDVGMYPSFKHEPHMRDLFNKKPSKWRKLFYKYKRGKEQYRFFGLPLFSIRHLENKRVYKFLGIKISRRPSINHVEH